jgi:hypothetical protein
MHTGVPPPSAAQASTVAAEARLLKRMYLRLRDAV